MKLDSKGLGKKLMGAATVVALVAAWPAIKSSKANWDADQAAKSAETRRQVQEYVKMREELGMSNPFPPKSMLEKQDAEARRLGGGRAVFDGAVSNLGPSYMEVEFTLSGAARCHDAVSGLSRQKDVRIVINGRSAHRWEAWKICGAGVNHIKIGRG